jgi:RNA polymerase sigma factor (sigma-70 family)
VDYKGDISYIDQVLDGKFNAFSYIVDRHKDKAYNLAFRICGNHEEAEEIAQDSFLKAYRSLKTFQRKSSFSTWLYRIVYNTAISSVRIKKNKVHSLDELPSDINNFIIDNTSEEEAEKEYRGSLINYALQKIDEEGRGLINLYYFEDMSISEISDVTGISKSNVKVKLFRERQKMSGIIEQFEKKKLLCHE